MAGNLNDVVFGLEVLLGLFPTTWYCLCAGENANQAASVVNPYSLLNAGHVEDAAALNPHAGLQVFLRF